MHRAIFVSQSRFWSLVLGLVLPLALQDVAAGQEAKKDKETKAQPEAREIKVDKVVVVDVGETKKVPIDMKVVDITVENTKILDKDIRVLDSSLLITGKSPGRTYIHMTDDKKNVVTYEILVPQRPEVSGEKEKKAATDFGLNLIQMYPGEKKLIPSKNKIVKVVIDNPNILLASPTKTKDSWELVAGRMVLEPEKTKVTEKNPLGQEKVTEIEVKKDFAFTKVYLVDAQENAEVLFVQIVPPPPPLRSMHMKKITFTALGTMSKGEAKLVSMSNKQKIKSVEDLIPGILDQELSKNGVFAQITGRSSGRTWLVLTDEEGNQEGFEIDVEPMLHRMFIFQGPAPYQPLPVLFRLDEKGQVIPEREREKK